MDNDGVMSLSQCKMYNISLDKVMSINYEDIIVRDLQHGEAKSAYAVIGKLNWINEYICLNSEEIILLISKHREFLSIIENCSGFSSNSDKSWDQFKYSNSLPISFF